jgi:hypothetical protein
MRSVSARLGGERHQRFGAGCHPRQMGVSLRQPAVQEIFRPVTSLEA